MGTREPRAAEFHQGPKGQSSLPCKRLRVAGTDLAFSIILEPPGEAQDPISRDLLSLDELSYPNALLMLQFLKPGQFVLDLGAHLGTLALVAAAAGCHVAAVDASPRNVALLERSKQANGFTRLHVLHRAASDRRETVRFRVEGAYGQVDWTADPAPQIRAFGAWLDWLKGLVRRGHKLPAGTGRVQVTAAPADRIVKQLGWPRVDFVKMDIEGFELKALRGMTGLLGRADAPPVLYECNGHALDCYGQGPHDLKSAFERLGYRNYALEPGDWLIPVAAADLQPICCMDYLAIKGPLPPLGPWKVAQPLDQQGLAIRVGWACGDTSFIGRRYTARALRAAAPELLAQPEVREGVARLRQDGHPEVRVEAQQIALPGESAAAA